MTKFDLKKDLKAQYQPRGNDFSELVVPPCSYLAIDGHGDPNSSESYAQAVAALYASAYTLKFAFKANGTDDFVVGPLEGLWSSENPADFVARSKDKWDWTMLIRIPAQVPRPLVTESLAVAAAKKPELPVAAIYILDLDEGLSLQIMHTGSYDEEGPVLHRLHAELMPEKQLTWNGRHHEIYLSDPRRVTASKLKTVLRQPVKRLPGQLG